MELFRKENYRLRVTDFDANMHFRPAAILEAFQEIAGTHAQSMGIGYYDMIEKNIIWVLVRVKYKLFAEPKLYQSVILETWPLQPSRLGFQREYLIKDENENVLVKGTSDWVCVHSEKRRIVSAADVYPENSIFREDKNFEEKLAKIRPFDEGSKHDITTRFSDLDMNGHVNNTKYADYVLDVLRLPKEKRVVSMQVDFHKELGAGAPFSLTVQQQNDSVLACGKSGDTNIFTCQMMLEDR